MNKAPAFQFYPADFLVGVAGMSHEEIGIYIKMLSYQWLKGGLPSDEKVLRKLLNTRRVVSQIVLEKFALTGDGVLQNTRLEKERAKQEDWRNKSAEGGRKSAESRSQRKEDGQNGGKGGSTTLQPNRLNQTPTLQSSSSSSSSDKNTPLPPEGDGFAEFWQAYPRKDARPNALKAWKRLLPPLEAVLASITRFKSTDQWTKDGGKFIPLPASWLNGERWKDQGTAVTSAADHAIENSRKIVDRLNADREPGHHYPTPAEEWEATKARKAREEAILAGEIEPE